jgi:hypothetical protein
MGKTISVFIEASGASKNPKGSILIFIDENAETPLEAGWHPQH